VTMAAQIADGPAQPLLEGKYALRVLQSRGRVSGQERRTPLGVTQLHDQWFLVSPDRGRDWVHNLVADGRCALLAGGERLPRRAVGVTGREAAAVVSTYLSTVTAPWALRAFPVGPNATVEEIVAHLDTIAVFRLDAETGR
jgi:deazaflavin-dependent oxidoreductase (nitroreductase family)